MTLSLVGDLMYVEDNEDIPVIVFHSGFISGKTLGPSYSSLVVHRDPLSIDARPYAQVDRCIFPSSVIIAFSDDDELPT